VININISSVQFAAGDVVADLAALLRQHGLPASAFCIEVTEGGFANAKTIRALMDARQRGFKIAMDDFGVGYSSLAQLPRLPLTSVKLDRSFILHAERAGDAAMLAAIVQLAHALAIEVVAEGVETPAQLELLAGCGCDAVQGYLFSRPLTPGALEAWLSGERSGSAQEQPTGHPLPI
jgi:EAL domain-containing protein (putative c-di-GMP-specific phosphodiesterase class I)